MAVVVFLIFLALAGDSVGTYFVMDAPRRRAQERLASGGGWQELDDRIRFTEEDRQLPGRKRELAATTAQEERERAMVAREAEFGAAPSPTTTWPTRTACCARTAETR